MSDSSEQIHKLIVVSDATCQREKADKPGSVGWGKSACGVIYLREEKNLKNVVEKRGKYLGEKTVPEAEYLGLIFALEHASSLCRLDVEAWLDAELVVRHLTGVYRLKAENLKPLLDKVRSLEHRFTSVSYFHHPRENDVAQAADRVAHQYLTER